MSTVVKRFVIAGILLTGFGLILNSCSKIDWSEANAEKNFRIERADVSVQVNDDASLTVTERLQFDFNGSFSGAYRDVTLAEGVTARNVQVSEDGRPFEPGGSTVLGSFDLPGRFGAEQLELSDRDDGGPTGGSRVVWHYRALDEDRTFELTYDIEGVARAYDDIVYVPWAVWGDQWEFWLDELDAEMSLASGDEEPTHAFLRPRRLGADPDIEAGGTSAEAERLASGDEAVLSAIFPRSAFESVDGAQVEKGDGLETVLAEEKAIDDDQSLFSKFASFVGGAIIPVEVGWTLLLLAIAGALYFMARELRGREVPKYLPEPPEDIPPALAYAMATEGKYDDRLVLATLLDLVDRGFYESKAAQGSELDLILSIPDDRPSPSGLETYEHKTMNFFDGLLETPCELGKLKDRIPKHSGSWRNKWEDMTEALDLAEKGQLGWVRDLLGWRSRLTLIALVGFIAIGIAYYSRTHYIAAPIFFLVAGPVLINLFPAEWLKRMNVASRERNQKWSAFSEWTEDFPRLSDDPPATLQLWRRIMVYAVAFGTAERLIGSGKIPAPVLEEASSTGIWLGPQLSGMNSGTTPNFQGFSSGFASQVAPEPSTSSGGSSGGGGFSGGGGGASGGGGGGAW